MLQTFSCLIQRYQRYQWRPLAQALSSAKKLNDFTVRPYFTPTVTMVLTNIDIIDSM